MHEVLALVGLESVARRRVGGFSLGMRQRLGIAGALLGDPPLLLFDEPVNGLDPEGIRWIRGFLRSLAAEGRTVLVSSHLMSELEDTADHLIVIGRGRLIADTSMRELLAARRRPRDGPRAAAGELMTCWPTPARRSARRRHADRRRPAGRADRRPRRRHGLRLHELSPHRTSLEEVFMASPTTRSTSDEHALRSEWTKLTALRGTSWSLLATLP